MNHRNSQWALWAITLLVLWAPLEAYAEAKPSTPPASDSANDQAKRQAKQLFLTGISFFDKGALEQALDYFLRSRDAYPSIQNISNAALCLQKLGRYDESLELFELLLADYRDRFSKAERDAIGPTLTMLRQRVGSLEVSANVSGMLVIDGRPRGTLPRRAPLRLLPGQHQVRVLADGHISYETTIAVAVGSMARVDARLQPLAAAGQLRIEDPDNIGSTVFIDGVAMGPTPWEGTLGPGAHLVWTSKGDIGSAPRNAVVIQGQQSVIKVRSMPLGPTVNVSVRPRQASIQLNGVQLGVGNWQGRLPVGQYDLAFNEAGYHPMRRPLLIGPANNPPQEITQALRVDSEHPRWPKADIGQFSLTAFAGYARALSLHGGADKNCDANCTAQAGMNAGTGGLRAAFRFRPGTAIELGVGYWALTQQSHRELISIDNGEHIRYALHDDILSHGPTLMFGASQQAPLGESFALVARAAFGVMFARSRNLMTGTAHGLNNSATLAIDGAGLVETAAPLFVQSEFAGELKLGSFILAASINSTLWLSSGAELSGRSVQLPDTCTGDPLSVGCASSGEVLPDETVHEMLLAIGPQLSVGYKF